MTTTEDIPYAIDIEFLELNDNPYFITILKHTDKNDMKNIHFNKS